MPSYPTGLTVSNHALITVSDALRERRTQLGTRWRRLSPGDQALLVLAHLRKGETYADLAAGFGIARLRGPGERANAQLKAWRILRKIRCCPYRTTDLVKAILTLIHLG